MESKRWISRTFKNDKMRYLERYQNKLEEVKLPSIATSEDALIMIPDGQFLRKYLPLIEDLIQHHTSFDRVEHFTFILLESAAEIMDYRNSSPSIPNLQNDQLSTESAAANERKRIVKLWQENNVNAGQSKVTVLPFADLSLRFNGDEGGEDEFDIFQYANMAVNNRSRCALSRAAQMIKASSLNGAKIILLSEDELLLESNTNDTTSSIQTMDCSGFIKVLSSLCTGVSEQEKGLITEHWHHIKQSCEEKYTRRNTIVPIGENHIEMDNYGHFEYLPDQELEYGVAQKKLLRSVLKVSRDNPKEAYCSVRTPDGSNVTYYLNEINGHFNRSIHEDTVVIEPLPSEQWEEPIGRRRLVHNSASDETTEDTDAKFRDTNNAVPTARVVGLHKSSHLRRKFVATMIPITGALRREDNFILVVPMDYKIPRIRIKTRIQHEKIQNKRLLVEIDGWDVASMSPHGHFVQILGDVGDLNTEVSCLLREHCIDLSPFSANALACLPMVDETGWKIDEEEISKRRDLRKSCRIFSVDPVGCQDIDDAMHARELPNGDIEVGVHIADVTHFVKHNSALDKEAARRATTFYLVDRRFDMLPSLLSSDICSLHDNVDRLAVSVIWTLSSDLETVKSIWYGRTVIQNVQAMTYDQAHNILHDIEPEEKGFIPPPPLTAGGAVNRGSISGLKKDLSVLTKLTRKLRTRRDNSGAVDLSGGDRGSELKFVLDESGNPTKVMPKKELEIHHTIAELMILANSFVAETIYTHFPDTSLLRVHGYAKVDSFDELESLMKASGIKFDGRSNKSLAQSLNEARSKGAGSINDSLFQALATRAMSEAQYICTGDYDGDSGLSHYGLGIGFYTHFTSPIRRYADMIVHRLLMESLVKREENSGQPPALSASTPNSLLPESNAISVLNGEGIQHKSSGLELGSDNLDDDDDDDAFLDSLIEGAEELALGPEKANGREGQSTERATDDKETNTQKSIYETTELAKTCNVLNSQNRIAKLSSMECQRLFLSLFFRENKTEVTRAVITDLRQNGMIVYVPKYDMKGPIFLTDREGNVQVDPSLLGLPSTSGLPPSSGFANFEACRMFPDGHCNLDICNDEEKSKIEIALPGGKSIISFRRLDVVTVQLSCDLSNVIARVPPPRLHLVSMDKKFKMKTATTTHSSGESKKSNIFPRNSQPVTTFLSPPGLGNTLSMFQVLSSIPIADLNNVPPRFSSSRNIKKVKDRVQTIKGRLYLNGFKAEELQSEFHGQDLDFGKHTSLTDQARVGDFDASRRIEKEATSRMQRIAAERRNAKKSKATKRK